jgi:hypothetical protein
MPIPTLAQFKALTGRTGVGKIFKTKNDLDEIFGILRTMETVGVHHASAIPMARQLRRACIAWLVANQGRVRVSRTAVSTLLDEAKARFIQETNHFYAGVQAGSNAAKTIKEVPNLPFGKQLTGKDVKRVGNQMSGGLVGEKKDRHWGPNIEGGMNLQYRNYTQAGGTLSIGAFTDHVYMANMEDDPSGQFLGAAQRSADDLRAIREGVKYCSLEERAAYRLEIKDGRLFDCEGAPYDTTGRETHFSKYGWAIFVLGFDNFLYSNTHLVNIFHHSSFFAGDPVQCGGELCCIAGQLRYLTNKTGHYRSGKFEYYRLLSFLNYQGVNLSKVLAAPEIHASTHFFRASEVFNAHGGRPSSGAPQRTTRPAELHAPGVPDWTEPK